MHGHHHMLASTAVAVAATLCLCSAPVAAQSPVARFIASVEGSPDIPAKAAQLIRDTWSECKDCDADEFLTQGLAVLSPKFRTGLDAYDAEQYETCAAVMSELRGDPNPFVSTYAAAYEIKALVAMERLLEANHRIERLVGGKRLGAGQLGTHSYFAPEIAFLRGFCLLSDLEYKTAATALKQFLADHPGAAPRLVIAAEQMLAELANRETEKIGEVVDLMNYSGRRLRAADSGQPVQARQQRILDLLDKMVDEAEKKESDAKKEKGEGGGSGGSGGSPGGQSPGSPLQQSMLPGGSGQDGALRAGRRANPAAVWGSMPPAERNRILQALRDSFPSRYRQLVEQYYEELAKKP